MLLIFKKKWLKNLTNGAWAYIASEYKKPSKIEYCRTRNFGLDTSSQPVQDKIATSCEQDSALEQNQSGGIRFSLKDNYNANAVDHFMERISTDPAVDGTAALDASIDISFVDKMLEHSKYVFHNKACRPPCKKVIAVEKLSYLQGWKTAFRYAVSHLENT